MPTSRLAGAVSWAPDIYNLEKIKGNLLMVTTATANKLIADVWFARADFANSTSDTIAYTYTVTNQGNAAIAGVVVTDDNLTPGNTSDDFNPSLQRRRHRQRRSAGCGRDLDLHGDAHGDAGRARQPAGDGPSSTWRR